MTVQLAMYTIRGLDKAPDLQQTAKLLKVSSQDIDEDFGIVTLNPNEGLYCVRANCRKVKPSFGPSESYEGPWDDPEIQAMDPPAD